MELENSTYTLDELREILGCFSIPQYLFTYRPLTAGFINNTFLVSAQGNPLYVLQRINDSVFEDIHGLMHNVKKALGLLKADDYVTLTLFQTNKKVSFLKHKKGYWRLMNYIPNSTTFDTTENPKIAFEAGKIIGRFHSLLQAENPKEFVDTIPQFHDLELRKAQFQDALQSAQKEKLKTAQEAITFAQGFFQELGKVDLKNLPLRVCHNDTKLNNILFSKTSKEALCLIDLDTIMSGYFFYDFGDAVRTIVNTAPEDEKDLGKITFDQNLFTSFVKGIVLHKPFLSEEELSSLSLGPIFMSFIHGLRALTDYLNHNKYYKVSYENQNLDRALSLFCFAKKASEQKEFMTRQILENLNT
ncbi:phosphotransferase enzyme family protein [Maribacter sp. 2210JD10-5]|uniref:phosphotransferase enzyme family protein n=1 Tax=Maribacter sp. 2210JD10-5 TaxID=3386272 RepID=UPI0039BCC790